MKNLKKELFEFRRNLDIEQEEVSRVIDKHLEKFDYTDPKSIVESLNNKLEIHTYDHSVRKLLEEFNNDVKENELEYDLKSLYKKVENSNQGQVYRHPLKVILDIINESDESTQRYRILNELSLYDFIPEVQKFVYNYTASPMQKANISSDGGQGEKVYSIVESVDEGYLTYVKDKWFLISEKEIEPTTPDKWFADRDKLKKINLLESALNYGEIQENKINFHIDDNVVIGVDLKDGDLYINEEKTEKETNLDDVFYSPMINHMKRDFYPIIAETVNNTEKFLELDFVTKVTNFTKPHLECYAFNYKDKIYLYSVDHRYARNFFEYESATKLVNEMKTELGFDLTYFYQNKFDKDTMIKRGLEDKEQKVLENIESIQNNIDKLDACIYIESSDELQEAKKELENEKERNNEELKHIREAKKGDRVYEIK